MRGWDVECWWGGMWVGGGGPGDLNKGMKKERWGEIEGSTQEIYSPPKRSRQRYKRVSSIFSLSLSARILPQSTLPLSQSKSSYFVFPSPLSSLPPCLPLPLSFLPLVFTFPCKPRFPSPPDPSSPLHSYHCLPLFPFSPSISYTTVSPSPILSTCLLLFIASSLPLPPSQHRLPQYSPVCRHTELTYFDSSKTR